jgi:hypothetical protein
MNKRILFTLLASLLGLAALAQPANDNCSTATPVAPTSCTAGTTTGANDSWVGTVGCQGGGSHPDAWYSFTATNNQLNIDLTSSGLGNPVEFVLAESPCGDCSCSFIIAGSVCGTAPLSDSIVGLTVGETYYFTVSSGGASGAYNVCIDNVPAVPRPGQDCPTAANICNEDPFGQATVASGNGTIRGNGSQEDMSAIVGSCFGTDERQSQWYKFTVSNGGTVEFNINPLVSSDDYDWMLLDITTSGCNLISGPATLTECDWSGCDGATGMSSSPGTEPGVITAGAGCFGGPAAFEPPATLITCRTYALLIDNFSISNNGFNFTWGGVTGGMTATIGPEPMANFSWSAASACPGTCTVNISGVVNRACYTYNWSWGDGTFSTGAGVTSHAYSACGTYTVTLTVTDALGCEFSYGQTISCLLADDGISLTARQVKDQVGLEWEMPSHISASKYFVQRSLDGSAFRQIHQEELPEQKAGLSRYAFNDLDPVPGMNYYRIQVLDAAGEAYSTQIVKVLYQPGMQGVVVAPNPAGDQLAVSFSAFGRTDLEVINLQGQVVRSLTLLDLEAGQYTQDIQLAGLASGVYHVRVMSNGAMQTATFLKQ